MPYHMNFFKRVINYFVTRLVFVLPDKTYIKIKFWLETGYRLDLNNPQSFNEKLQWLKFNDQHDEYTMMVDKYLVKDYVASLIGEKYLIPTIGVYNTIEEIKWEDLPQQFDLKTTGDSGGVIVCKDKTKLNIDEAKKKLGKLKNRNYYKYNKEYPYKNVHPRYIVEEYIVDESGYELKDYKFFCFNGEPMFVQIDFDRYSNHRRNVYDINWNLLDLQIKFPKGHDRVFPRPENYDEMVEVARMLSKGIPHVRIDLYNVTGKIYFGEMTFFHGSGMEVFTPLEWDYKFGDFIKLPVSR